MSTIGEYKKNHDICNTEGIIGLNKQIVSLLLPAVPNDLVSCEDTVNPVGASTLSFLQPAAKASLSQACAEKGRRVDLIHGFRTVAHQHILYYWGQHQRCGIKVVARPGHSPHELGIAIDIENPQAWITVLKHHHWSWQGDNDPSHFTYTGDGINPNVRVEEVRAFQRLWNQHNPADLIAEDGAYGTQETAPRLDKSPIQGFQ